MMVKPKKHKWVTEALEKDNNLLSVWPSKDDLSSDAKLTKFFDIVEKIGNDPRVVDCKRVEHKEHNVVFIFTIDKDYDQPTD